MISDPQDPNPRGHLRLAGASPEAQRDTLFDIARSSPGLWNALTVLRDLDLPQGWIVSGAIYNQVWNHLTGRPDLYGVKDIDVFYFDPDPSPAAEAEAISRVAAALPGPPPTEARNVRLWREGRYESAVQPVGDFACRSYCVALRLDAFGTLHLHAPFGLDDIFAFRLAPNARLDNRARPAAKIERQILLWPELGASV